MEFSNPSSMYKKVRATSLTDVMDVFSSSRLPVKVLQSQQIILSSSEMVNFPDFNFSISRKNRWLWFCFFVAFGLFCRFSVLFFSFSKGGFGGIFYFLSLPFTRKVTQILFCSLKYYKGMVTICILLIFLSFCQCNSFLLLILTEKVRQLSCGNL